MPSSPSQSFDWRTANGIAAIGVLGLFLYSVHSILSPILLFLLVLLVLSPYAGTHGYVVAVTAAGSLTALWIVHTTGFLLAPFLLAMALAYILHPLVDRLERRRLPRAAAVAVLALPVLAIVALVALVGIPALSAQIADLIRATPAFLSSLESRVAALQTELGSGGVGGRYGTMLAERLQSIRPDAVMAWLQARQNDVAAELWSGILGVGRGIGAVLVIVGYLFLTPILTFYLLRDWKVLVARTADLVPPVRRAGVFAFAHEYDRLLSRYLRGQLTEAAIVGVLTWLGYQIAGIPFAILLGVVYSLCYFIPYVGGMMAVVPAVLIALLSGDPVTALLKVAAVFAVVQILDVWIMGPRIVGGAVGLHPVWLIFSFSIFGYFLGFVGVLVAVPLAVVVKLLLHRTLDRYRASRLYLSDMPVVAPPEPAAATQPAPA